jgi:hypothetical protein
MEYCARLSMLEENYRFLLARPSTPITGVSSAAFIRAGQTPVSPAKAASFQQLAIYADWHPRCITCYVRRPTIRGSEGPEIEGTKRMHVLAAPDSNAEKAKRTKTQHGRDPGSF